MRQLLVLAKINNENFNLQVVTSQKLEKILDNNVIIKTYELCYFLSSKILKKHINNRN